MTVQQLINKLSQIEDKSKEVVYAEHDDIDSRGNDWYSTGKIDEVTIWFDKVWLKNNWK